jgi:hypothetical protein
MMRCAPDDAGQIAGVEGVIFGVLVFVLGTLVIANAWGVVDAKIAASSAAREATRAFVESPSAERADALARAEEAATETITGLGRAPDRMHLVVESAELARCARVTMRVDYDVPLIIIPLLGRHGSGFTASGRHSEVVDPFRSGPATAGSCPAGLHQ